jgi:hypothetical protein
MKKRLINDYEFVKSSIILIDFSYIFLLPIQGRLACSNVLVNLVCRDKRVSAKYREVNF